MKSSTRLPIYIVNNPKKHVWKVYCKTKLKHYFKTLKVLKIVTLPTLAMKSALGTSRLLFESQP